MCSPQPNAVGELPHGRSALASSCFRFCRTPREDAPPHPLFRCADDEVPRALGVEQDYEQSRTAAQDRIAEKQAELHAVMLRKAATEEVDLSALKSMGARWMAANQSNRVCCIHVLACLCPFRDFGVAAGAAVQSEEKVTAKQRARCCELLVDAGAAQTLADAQALLPLMKSTNPPKPERVRRLLAALRLCRWDVTAFRRSWFGASPVRVVQRSEFLTATDIPCVASFSAFPSASLNSLAEQQRCRAHEMASASRAASPTLHGLHPPPVWL